MEVVNSTFLPGDPRLIDHIVYELKSQGIFDNFRKECIADVDTKPAYQNLRQRVEGSVSGFLKTQKWRSDMNKNHVREMLRKNISESGFLETGVERIVDQVVNPKINSIFLPQVENVVYKVLGIEKPTAFDDLKKEEKEESSNIDLLPNDLEAVSPESEPQDKKLETSIDSKNDKIDEDESPPFEPLEESMPMEENSVDSNLSGISGLVSHDSNHSVEHKPVPMETSNQDSQFSKQSSDDRLSIVMSDDQEIKMEINEDSRASKASVGKSTDLSFKSIDVTDSSSTTKIMQSQEKPDEPEKRSDSKKTDKHRSSHRHSSHRSRHDSRDYKDRKSDRDKKDHKSSRTSEDSKEKRDKDKDRKDRSRSGKDDRGSKSSKERDRTSSNSKHKKRDSKDSSDHKDDKPKSESKDSKSRDRSKEDSKSKSHAKKTDSKSHSKHNGKSKTESSDSVKSSSKDSDKRHDKHKKDERHSSEKRSDKYKDKKDPKRDGKKEKDDHYSLKEKKSHRRSTDRDSSDGHSGTHSSSSSYTELTTPSQVQKSSQESSLVSGSSSGRDSGNSDAVLTAGNINISSIPCVLNEEEHSQIIASVPHLKLIKPKFASNIFEARRLMKIRRKLGKLEKQKQMELVRANNTLKSIAVNKMNNHVTAEDENNHKQPRPEVVKKHVNNSHVKSYKYDEKSFAMTNEDNLVEEVQLSEDMELQTSVISKESWDAIEAKLNAQNILKVDYNSYIDTRLEKPVVPEESDRRGFITKDQLEAKKRLDLLCKVIEEQELYLARIRQDCMLQFHKEKLLLEDVDDEIHKLPKIDVLDVISNNEVIFSPGRGIKRIASDHDMRNNNKVNKELGDLLSDRLNELTENHDQSSNPTPKSKKSKLTDTSVNSVENFNLPLSPAESDKSFNSVGDKKGDVLDGRGKRNRAISNQRYSSDDLYKPRLQFSSKRRRITKNSEIN